VTTDEEEYNTAQIKCDISAAWAGGVNGSEIIHKFIEQLGSVIHQNTTIYLLLSSENEIKQILRVMKEKYDFKNEVRIFKFSYCYAGKPKMKLYSYINLINKNVKIK
jgi:hypothetical protein